MTQSQKFDEAMVKGHATNSTNVQKEGWKKKRNHANIANR